MSAIKKMPLLLKNFIPQFIKTSLKAANAAIIKTSAEAQSLPFDKSSREPWFGWLAALLTIFHWLGDSISSIDLKLKWSNYDR